MPQPRPDPAPRKYPPWVAVLRRSVRTPDEMLGGQTANGIADWLLSDAMREGDLLVLFEMLVWRIVAMGIPLDRASLHVGTLHPEFFGFAWNWLRADGICDEVRVEEGARTSEAYRRNPLYRVIEYGETIVGLTSDPDVRARFPLFADLAAEGIEEYIAMPLGGGGAYHNAATVATRHPEGFSPENRADLERIFELFALHVERHIVLRIAANVLDIYLGHAAGGRVLAGSIKRGSGEPIRAVIWASDLRGFTALSERLAGPDMIVLLNAYFDVMAGAVMAHNGEVLKFIGDGLLAVFPYSSFPTPEAAAVSALSAAEAAVAAVARLNVEPPEELAALEGWRPLRTGVALHEGDVFFGNVGAPQRLDFTVIGRAVNVASRVESLTKEVGRDVLLTEPVAALLDVPLERLGDFALRGVTGIQAVFAPVLRA